LFLHNLIRKLDKFYYGHSSALKERICKHNTKHKGFTGKVNDWKLVYSEKFNTKKAAYARERQVKAWKNRKRVENLIVKFNAGSEHPD